MTEWGLPYFCVVHFILSCCKPGLCHYCILCQQQNSMMYNIVKCSLFICSLLVTVMELEKLLQVTQNTSRRLNRRVGLRKWRGTTELHLKRNSWDFSCFWHTPAQAPATKQHPFLWPPYTFRGERAKSYLFLGTYCISRQLHHREKILIFVFSVPLFHR